MFILFRGSLKKLNAFIEHANTFQNSIKFTFEYSKKTVNFLDVQVTKDKYHKLQTSIYRKPTKKNLLLKFSSFHPFHIFRNLVYNQSLRLCTIISTRYQLSTELNNLKQIFLARGYPERLIDTQIKKALLINRKHLLKSRPKKTAKRMLLFKMKHSILDKYRSAHIRKLWKSHIRDPALKTLWPNPPLTSISRQKNLQDYLVHTKLRV